jgi:hypothetical protein
MKGMFVVHPQRKFAAKVKEVLLLYNHSKALEDVRH